MVDAATDPDPEKPLEIVVSGGHPAEVRDAIVTAAAGHRVSFYPTAVDALPALAKADAFAGTLTGSQLTNASALRWVHSWAAGANADLSPEMIASDVTLTSSVGNGAVPLAEHSMLLMMMLNRDVGRWMRAQSQHRWDRFTHGELNGKTLGIVGLGHSGQDLARKAKAFHMRVIGLRRRSIPVADIDALYTSGDLDTFLRAADFVVVTAPITEQTAGMFDKEQFQAMKETAFWICISRGGIARDDALLQALKEGRIAGAGIDAHGVEPLPADSPFWELDNVIITPHNGATTTGTAERGIEIFLDNLRRFVDGRPLVNLVDKTAGY